jgi:hypothetical protein
VQSQVRFNRVPEKVPEKVVPKPVTDSGSFQRRSRGFHTTLEVPGSAPSWIFLRRYHFPGRDTLPPY